MQDDEIDALVARAADRPVDTARLRSAVAAGLAQRDDLFGWMSRGRMRLVPAAFAVLLVATPLTIARLPADPEMLVAAVALGDPLLLGPGDLP